MSSQIETTSKTLPPSTASLNRASASNPTSAGKSSTSPQTTPSTRRMRLKKKEPQTPPTRRSKKDHSRELAKASSRGVRRTDSPIDAYLDQKYRECVLGEVLPTDSSPQSLLDNANSQLAASTALSAVPPQSTLLDCPDHDENKIQQRLTPEFLKDVGSCLHQDGGDSSLMTSPTTEISKSSMDFLPEDFSPVDLARAQSDDLLPFQSLLTSLEKQDSIFGDNQDDLLQILSGSAGPEPTAHPFQAPNVVGAGSPWLNKTSTVPGNDFNIVTPVESQTAGRQSMFSPASLLDYGDGGTELTFNISLTLPDEDPDDDACGKNGGVSLAPSTNSVTRRAPKRVSFNPTEVHEVRTSATKQPQQQQASNIEQSTNSCVSNWAGVVHDADLSELGAKVGKKKKRKTAPTQSALGARTAKRIATKATSKSIPGKRKKEAQEIWMSHYQDAKKFFLEHGHCAISGPYVKCPSLVGWAKRQRYMFRLHKTGSRKQGDEWKTRFQLLNDINFCWDLGERAWNEKFEQVKKLIEDHGSLDNYYASRGRRNKRIQSWLNTQKNKYHAFFEGETAKVLEPWQIQKLESLPLQWEATRTSSDDSETDL